MDSLKKRYKGIPVEERLPIGTVETEELSSAEREGEAVKQLYDNDQNHLIEQIPYTYKFLRDVNFAVFAVNLSSTKFKSSKFHKTIVIHWKHKV